jgi:hypothetical protein
LSCGAHSFHYNLFAINAQKIAVSLTEQLLNRIAEPKSHAVTLKLNKKNILYSGSFLDCRNTTIPNTKIANALINGSKNEIS